MTRDLVKWVLAGIVVLVLVGLFVWLGFWQLDRHAVRAEENRLGASRLSGEPLALGRLTIDGDSDVEFRMVRVQGEFQPSREVLVRSQVSLGQAGFHVITPLLLDDGSAILVNRGWVPLNMDTPPVAAAPPVGQTEVTGWLQPSQTRPALGPVDPPGRLEVVSRVDIGRIAQQMDVVLAPYYLVQTSPESEQLPLRVRPPDFFDAGPHRGYAIQWFGFALTGLVGFVLLYRAKGRRPMGESERA